MARKKKHGPSAAGSGWLTTYADMVTLMLCFFVMLFEPSEVDVTQLMALSASISGDPTGGGLSVSAGRLSDLGNTISSMPSMEKGKMLASALKKAVSLFAPEIKTNKIAVTSDERGIVISLASDVFFYPGSAELNIAESRDPNVWKSNWELSSARAINILHSLTDFGAQESRFSVAGYADTRPIFSNDTAEGRAYNRRVDIIILDDAHF